MDQKGGFERVQICKRTSYEELNLGICLVLSIAGMINREQQQVIAYLTAENRVLKEQLKKHDRLRFTDRQRRLLAVKAKELGRAALRKLDTVVCPDTLLRWYPQLVAQKYDGSGS